MAERQYRTTEIPGLAAQHVIITPNCRRRGDQVALSDAMARVVEAYSACQKTEEDIHIVLTCDWPQWQEERERRKREDG